MQFGKSYSSRSQAAKKSSRKRGQSAVGRHFEALEVRQLLSSAVSPVVASSANLTASALLSPQNSPANPAGTNLSVASALGTYGGTTNLQATLTAADGSSIPGQNVTFLINGTLWTVNGNAVTATTDSNGVATLTGVSLAGIDAGSYNLTAYYAGSSSYSESSATGTLTVGQASPTVNITDAGGTYNGSAFPVTAVSITGAGGLNDSNLNDVTLDYVNTDTNTDLGSTAPTNAGDYSVIADFAGSADYAPATGSAQFTITPALLEISAVTDSKTYDGTTADSATPSFQVRGLAANTLYSTDTLTNLFQGFASKDAMGQGGSTLQVTSDTLSDPNNYSIAESTAPGTITPAALTLSAVSDSKTYDGTTSDSLTPTVSGLQGGDTVTGLSQAFNSKDVSTADTLSVQPGYSINDGADGADYTVMTNTAPGTISAAPLTISAVTDSKTYDGTTSDSLTPTVSGLQGGDTVTGLSQAFNSKDVSTANTLSVQPGYSINDGADGADYAVTTDTAPGTISAAPLTISAVTDSKTYDGTTSDSLTPTVSGLQGGDTVTGLSQAFNSKDVSTADTLSVQPGYSINDGADGADYTVTTDTAPGTISAAPLTISAVTDSKTYDGTTSDSLTPTVSGLQGGDTVTGLSQAFNSKDVSTADTLSVQPGYSINDGADGADYTVTTDTAPGTITPAALTLSAVGDSKTYDGTTSDSLTPTVSGLQGSDTVTDLSQAFNSKDVPTANTLSVQPGYSINDGADGADYTVQLYTATGTITPANITYQIGNDSQTYGASANLNGDLPGAFSTGVNGEALDISYASTGDTAAASVSGSPYAITGTVSDGTGLASDYNVTLENGNLTVNAANTSTSVSSATAMFNGGTVQLDAQVSAVSPSTAAVNEGTVTFYILDSSSDVLAQVTSGTVSNGSATAQLSLAGLNAGSYAITADYNPAASSANFNASEATIPATLTISAQSTSLSLAPATGAYSETTNLVATLTAGGTGVANETISFTMNGAPVGTATTNSNGIATLSNVALVSLPVGQYAIQASFSTDPNYVPSSASSTASVSQAPLEVTNVIGTGTYNGSEVLTASLVETDTSDPVAGEEITFSFNGNSYTATSDASGVATVSGVSVAGLNAGSYNVSASAQGDSDYQPATAVNGTAVVNPLVDTLTLSNATGTYGGSTTLTATLESGSTALGGQTLTFYINGKLWIIDGNPVTATTDSNGVASLVGVSLVGIDAGSNSITAFYAGNSTYSPSSATATLNIGQASSAVSVTDAGGSYNGSAFPVTAVSITGAGGLNDLNVNDVTLDYVNTDTNTDLGSVAPTNAGDYSVTATYAGDANHTGSTSAAADFTIAQAGSTVSVTDAGGTYNGSAFPVTAVSITGAGGLDDSNVNDVTLDYVNTDTNTDLGSVAPTNAGDYSVAATYAGDANHTGSSSHAVDFTIGQASSAVGVTDAGGTYNGSAFPVTTVSITGAGGLNDSSLNDVTLDYVNIDTNTDLGSTAPINAGDYSVAATYAGDANHTGNSSAAVDFTIAQASSAVSVTDAGGTYNGSAFPVTTVSITGAGGLDDSNLNDVTLDYVNTDTNTDLGSSAPTNAGDYAVTATYAGDANHVGNSATADFTIGEASSTVSVTDAGGTYNGSAFPVTAVSITGAGGLNDSNVNDVTLDYVNTDTNMDLGSTAPTNAGDYSVAATYAGDANHTGSSSDAVDFTIGKASSAVGVTDAGGTYNGSAFPVTAVSITGAGGLNDSSLNDVTLDYVNIDTNTDLGSVAPTNAGDYSVTATYAGDANHTGSTSAAADFTIAQAGSVVSVTDAGGTYNDSAFPVTAVSITGAGGLDDTNLNDLTLDYINTDTNTDLGSVAPTNAGDYSVAATYAGDANHTGNSATADFTIGQATPTIDLTASNVTYDGSAQGATGEEVYGLNGLDLGPASLTYYDDGVALTGTPINAGTYTVDANFAGTTDYAAETASTNFTITPLGITGQVKASNKVYDGTTNATAQAAGLNGVIGSDDVSLQVDSASFNSKDVATANTVTAQVELVGSESADYTLVDAKDNPTSTETAGAEISPASLTISAVTDSKVYDGTTNDSLTPTVSGLQGSDTITGLSQAFNSKDVSTANTLSVQSGYSINDGVDGADYTVTTNTAPGTITPLGITGQVKASNKVYDGTTNATAQAAGLNGVIGSDDVSLQVDSASFNSKDVATANTVTAQVELVGSESADYTLVDAKDNPTSTETAGAEISPASLTISAVTDSKVYDGTTNDSARPTFQVQVQGMPADTLYGSDAFTSLSQGFVSKDVMGTDGSTLEVTGYTFKDGNDGADYTVQLYTATGTITPANITYQIGNDSQTYGASANLNGDLPGAFSTGVNGEALDINYASTGDTAAASVSGSPYAITGTVSDGTGLASDYNVTLENGNLTVNAANTSTSVSSATAMFNGGTVQLDAQVSAVSPSTAAVNEGTVTFYILDSSSDVLAQVTSGTVSNGSATAQLSLAGLNAGSYAITADYNPAASSANFNASEATIPATLTISAQPPLVSSVGPASGPASGGTTVTILGSGFTGATAVDFGSAPATGFTVNNDGSITAVDPAGIAGTAVDVTVVTAGGTSATSATDQFNYVTNPVVISSVVVNGGNTALAGVQRSMVTSILYTFNQAVLLSGTNAFSIAVHSGQSGTVPTLSWSAVSPDASGGSTQWVVTFSGTGVSGGSIGNGVYDITLNTAAVTSESNPTATIVPRPADTFYRLFGDINGDGVVNAADNFQLKAALSVYNAAFDANADGVVNAADNFQFKNSQSYNFASSGIVYTI